MAQIARIWSFETPTSKFQQCCAMLNNIAKKNTLLTTIDRDPASYFTLGVKKYHSTESWINDYGYL